MNNFESGNLVAELTGSPNIQYIINDDSTFALTDFKVLKGQNDKLIKCAKVRYNGKIKLIYFTSEMKSMKNMIPLLDADGFITVVANLILSVNEIKNNGFLELTNICLSFDKIFVEPNTLSVSLIYLPINNSFDANDSIENELKTELIKCISSTSIFTTDKLNRICSHLSNGTLSLEKLHNCLIDEVNGSVENANTDNNKENKNKVNSMYQPELRFCSVNAPVNINFIINSKEYLIGKSPDKVDGVIPFNKAISRVHCKIVYQNNHYYIFDMGSANGTFVNTKRIPPRYPEFIKNGDIVRLANSDFVIKI